MEGMTLEKLQVIIEAYTKPYRDELEKVKQQTRAATTEIEKQTSQISTRVNGTMSRVNSAVSRAGRAVRSALGVVGIAAIVAFTKSCVDLGSDLQEVQNVVDVTFGSMSAQVDSFSKNAITQFGLSELTAKRYMGTYGAMAKSFGIVGEAGYQMSAAITGLTGDVASFYNLSPDEAYTKLKSIFTGETESLKELGVVMTQTALDQYALNNGFGKTTAKMTEQEKAILRYQFVMSSLADASGDFARTSGSWANQTRILALQFDSLRATIGQGLINAFTPVIRAVNTLLSRLQTLAAYFKAFTVALFGDAGSGSTGDTLGSAAGSSGDIADNMGSAAGSAKRMREYMLGIDELNVLNPDDGSESGGGSGGAGGSLDLGDLSGDWTEAFVPDASELVDKICQAFKDGDYRLAGEYIGAGITDALKDIDWPNVYQAAENFGHDLADFLNGLISPELFSSVGQTIAGALNTGLHFLDSYGETFDWSNFGESIAGGINGFFEDFDFSLLAGTINTWVHGILTAITTAVQETNWALIGTEIGNFLRELDWFQLLKDIAGVIGSALIAVFELVGGSLSVAPIETAIALAFIGLSSSQKIKNAIGTLSALSTKVQGAINLIAESKYLSLAPIAAGLLGLGAAFETIQNSYLSEVAADINTWLNQLGVKELADNISRTAGEIDGLGDSIQNAQAALDAESADLDRLVDEYFRLAEQTELTGAQQLLLKEYAEELVRTVPELSEQIDTQTGAFTGQKDAVYEAVSAHKEYAAALAYQEIIAEYTKQLAKAEIELQANADKYNLCRERLDALNYVMENSERGSHQQTQALQELGETWGVQINTWEEANEYAGAMTEGMDRCTESENLLASAVEDANLKINAANEKYNEIAGTLQSVSGETDTLSSAIGTTIPKNINEGIANNPIDLTPIQTGILAGSESMHSSGEQLGRDTLAGYNSGIEDRITESETTVTGWGNTIIDLFKSLLGIHSPSTVFYDLATDTIAGYNNGIVASQESGAATMQAFGDAVWGALHTAADTAWEGIKTTIGTKWGETVTQWGIDVSAWWDTDVAPWFTRAKWEGIAENFRKAIKTKWDAMDIQWGTDIQSWWTNDVSSWFTFEKWAGIADNLCSGIKTKWDAMNVQWGTDIESWWDDDVSPWFTLEKWQAEALRIKDAIIGALGEMVSQWKLDIQSWWDDDVSPWFSYETWLDVLKDLPGAFRQGFQDAIDAAGRIVSNFLDGIKRKIRDLFSDAEDEADSYDDWSGGDDDDPYHNGPGYARASSISYTVATPQTISQYSSGGQPRTGELFMANEKGPELIGRIGGKTSVVNNEQIVTAVSEGVADAFARALEQSQGNDSGEPIVINLTVDGRTLSTVSTNTKRRGGFNFHPA